MWDMRAITEDGEHGLQLCEIGSTGRNNERSIQEFAEEFLGLNERMAWL